MSNSKKDKLDDVSNENIESSTIDDSTSNKKSRFNKSKSISEVFDKLDFDDTSNDDADVQNELDNFDIDNLDMSDVQKDSNPVNNLDDSDDTLDESEIDEIIPIHNEINQGFDESDSSFDENSIENGSSMEFANKEEIFDEELNKSSNESEKDLESINDVANFDEANEESSKISSENNNAVEKNHAEDNDSDKRLNINSNNSKGPNAEKPKKKSSSQGVIINSNSKKTSNNNSFADFAFDSSMAIYIIGFVVGLFIFIMGIFYYNSGSERVVDNVLAGETAGLAVILMIIGLIILGFSILLFFSSRNSSSKVLNTFNDIKSIDYDDVKDDALSRDDFDSLFSKVLNKDNSDDSDNESVETPADQSIDSLISNLNKGMSNPSEIKINPFKQNNKSTKDSNSKNSDLTTFEDSTEDLNTYSDSSVDEIIPAHVESSTQDSSFSKENNIPQEEITNSDSISDDSLDVVDYDSISNDLDIDLKPTGSVILNSDENFEEGIKTKNNNHKFVKSVDLSSIIDDEQESSLRDLDLNDMEESDFNNDITDEKSDNVGEISAGEELIDKKEVNEKIDESEKEN